VAARLPAPWPPRADGCAGWSVAAEGARGCEGHLRQGATGPPTSPLIDPSCPDARQDSWETHWRVLWAGRYLPSGSAKPHSASPAGVPGAGLGPSTPLGPPPRPGYRRWFECEKSRRAPPPSPLGVQRALGPPRSIGSRGAAVCPIAGPALLCKEAKRCKGPQGGHSRRKQGLRDALIVFMTATLSGTDWGYRLQRVHWVISQRATIICAAQILP
jgi:hypothetical protein